MYLVVIATQYRTFVYLLTPEYKHLWVEHKPSRPGPRPPTPTPVPNDHHPHPEKGPRAKEGSTWSKPANQSNNRMKQSQPPNEFCSQPYEPSTPLNPNMNFPTVPSPTRTPISNTCPRTQTP
ncbi:hypothetical protein AMECASPLE_038187 [Ameca splendens]|uniref:Uncharacterized protein n=1 Tax=Ameca splendens TaxID=208324 RepID=A0ABV0XWZ1_9TELE